MTSFGAPLPADAGDSVTLAIGVEPATSRRTSDHRITGNRQPERIPNPHAVECSALPGIQPGELWVVEHSSTDPHLPHFGRHAVTSANVVIYDRALYPILAANLPRGGYAEPAPWPVEAIDRTVDRCIQFARDGWSVVWLADRGTLRDARISRMIERMISAGCPASLSVTLFASANGSISQQTETELGRIEIVIDATTPEVPLTITFASVGTGATAHLHAISSNGLAG